MRRKLYIVDMGDYQVIFDQDHTPIGCWSCDDADWRNEYFSPFMMRLGFEPQIVYGDTWDEMASRYAKEFWR